MDTKWKNRKKTISFLIFFLGISITIGSLTDLLAHKPDGVKLWQTDRLLDDDYQQTKRFREYVAGHLKDFLIMATGGEGLMGIWGYRNGMYYGNDYWYDGYYNEIFDDYAENFVLQSPVNFDMEYDLLSSEVLLDLGYSLENILAITESCTDILNDMTDRENWDSNTLDSYRDTLEAYRNAFDDFLHSIRNYLSYPSDTAGEDIASLTAEQKKQLAQKYHDAVKGDKNLLYTIAFDGQVLYSNTDLLPADGSMSAPEGYNFVLYFDGEKVRILKDGKEIDVYGDGLYRETNDWYVPGYSNFRLEEGMKKAAVCIAAAKEPVLYLEGTYGSSIQYDNTLYWLDSNLRSRRRLLLNDLFYLCGGILLLLLSFLTRKSRREAAEGIARFQAKIWIEGKVLLLLLAFYILYMLFLFLVMNSSEYSLWQEFSHAYDYGYSAEVISDLGWMLAYSIPSPFWLSLFWCIWLLWNDLHYNKKIWKNSLAAKLSRTFSQKSLNYPLSRKMRRRSSILFAASLLYGLLMFSGMIYLVAADRRNQNLFLSLFCLAAVLTVCFLVLQFRSGSKNAETARDIETVSCRIGEIRNGNYTCTSSGQDAGTDAGQTPSRDSQDTAAPDSGSSESGQTAENAAHTPGRDLENMMEQLEDIRHGMAKAVDEQMKSERMKVELIANVSHDIKTPLTSIISYVEFLKQEKELPDHVKDYVRILDEKSQRLKNMVQDVFAVSKAASGELPMQMEILDFGKLLRQTLADMEEEIGRSAVTFRTEIPDAPMLITADGQRLYRVFQNLFQNCLKYSLEGSRVYVTLKAEGSLAAASVKNTSRRELEKSRDFAERFARGDQSRTDGGSGLGLSIAQSFTEACGGKFSWETDADLFIVKVSFLFQQP